MKNAKVLLALFVIVLCCSFAAGDWIDFQSAAGRFKMKFPKQPAPSTQKTQTGGVPIVIHMFVYDATKYKDDNEIYLAMYCDYPKDLVNSEFRDEIVDTILKASINGMAENMKGEVRSMENTTYKDYPGKKVKLFMKEENGYAYVRMYLVHNRMYMMEVLCDPKNDNNASIDKFFSSFSCTEPEPSKPPVKKKP